MPGLFGSEACVVKKRVESRIQSAEMKFMKAADKITFVIQMSEGGVSTIEGMPTITVGSC